MIQVLAKIHLFENGRKTPFPSGYRPLFNFSGKTSKFSGKIIITGFEKFLPGMTENVEIIFIDHESLKDIKVGEKFTFDEGHILLGEGSIIKLI